MKRTMTILLGMLLCLTLHPFRLEGHTSPPSSASDSLLVMFWNLENFFDYHKESEERKWTSRRFYRKCDAVSKTILYASDKYGRVPDIIGVCEIDSEYVLRQLIYQQVLRKLGYLYIHFDSPDRRGIDCGLLYRADVVGRPYKAFPAHIYDSLGKVIPTRDILVVQFDSLSVLVNHHPSKLGGGGAYRRECAMYRMRHLADSLKVNYYSRVLSIGDFNDDIWGEGDDGTIRFEGKWEKIDGALLYGRGSITQAPLLAPFLLTPDAAYGGMKPLRTFSGPRYLGGVSDHLPIIVHLHY